MAFLLRACVGITILINVISYEIFTPYGAPDSLIAISLEGVTSLSLPDYEATSSEWSDPQPHVHFYLDRQNHCYYWTDDESTVYKTEFPGVNATTSIVYTSAPGRTIVGLDVDTYEDLLFVTEYRWYVTVVFLKTGYSRILYRGSNPALLQLDTTKKLMYWRETMNTGQMIYSSKYNGQGHQPIMQSTRGRIGDFIVTFNNNVRSVYWCDYSTHTILALPTQTSVREVLVQLHVGEHLLSSSCSLALHNDVLYFTFEATHRQIFSTSTTASGRYSTVLRSSSRLIHQLHISTTMEGVTSACAVHNGGCSDLCFPSPEPSCHCIDLERLLFDGKTCTFSGGKQPGLLYKTQDNELCYIATPPTLHRTGSNRRDQIECTTVYLPEEAQLNLKALRMDYHPDLAVDTYQSKITNITTGDKKFSYIGPISFDHTIGDICVDWSVGNVYWTDPDGDQIWVSRYGGVYMRVLTDEVKRPSYIVVDSVKRQLFWIENHYQNRVEVKTSFMDGSDIQMFTSFMTAHVKSLSLDFTDNSLYILCDEGLLSFPLALSGQQLSSNILTSGRWHNFAVFQNTFIGITDTEVQFYDKLTASLITNLDLPNDAPQNITDFISYHETSTEKLNRKTSECSNNNGGCEQICLTSENSYRCTCRFGLFIDGDGKSCVSSDRLPEEFLILSSNAHRSLYFMGNNRRTNAIQGIPVNDRPVAAKYSPQTDYIYWMVNVEYYNFTSTRFSIIKRTQLRNDNATVEIIFDGRKGNNSIGNFDIIFTGGQDLIYYLDGSLNQLRMITGDGLHIKLISSGISFPRDIAIDHNSGRVYITSDNRLIRTNLDGSDTILLQRGSMTGVAWDEKNQEVLYCDTSSGNVFRYNGTSDKSTVLINGHSTDQSCDIAVSNDNVYWVDAQERGVQFVKNDLSEEHQYVRLSNRMMLYADSVQYVNMTAMADPCDGYNCTHICVSLPEAVRCICPQFRSREEEMNDPCREESFKTVPEIAEEDWYGSDFNDFDHGDILDWRKASTQFGFTSNSILIMGVIGGVTLMVLILVIVLLAVKCKKRGSKNDHQYYRQPSSTSSSLSQQLSVQSHSTAPTTFTRSISINTSSTTASSEGSLTNKPGKEIIFDLAFNSIASPASTKGHTLEYEA